MRNMVLSTIVCMLLISPDSYGQGAVTQPILSFAAAKLIGEAALEACTSQGYHTSVVVIDRAGNLLVVLRDELAHPGTIGMAQQKAQTAVLFRRSTLEFQQRTAADPSLMPQRDVPGILALAGGVPIRLNGEIIGGVASSGANQVSDDECARVGLAKAEELLN